MQTTSGNVISVLITDHREIERSFVELERGEGTPEHRRDLADHVIAELVRHSVAEEQYLYPAVRRALPDGEETAEHELDEHAEAEQTMKDLDGVDPTDARFDELVARLIEQVRHHVEEEENQLFPKLADACTVAELDDLGTKILRAKELAPTRPHPSAPDRPPLNKLLGPGTALVDRVRDALSGRAT